MNSALKTLALLALSTRLLHAEEAPAFVVQEQGANTKTWVQTNDAGEITSSFVEMATGLSRWDSSAQKWVDADPSIVIVGGQEGGAVAQNGQHRLTLSADANSTNATVNVEMADGQRIQLQTIGIALTTLDNSRSMFIGEVRTSIGEQIDANTVIFEDAFAPVRADLRVRNTLSGLESDVILREKIDPTDWGFNINDCRLEAWSQILASPAVRVSSEKIAGRAAGNADQDQQISFGGMAFAKGTAFRLDTILPGPSEQLAAIRVAKELVSFPEDNLYFLIEAVPFLEAKPTLDTLPVNEARLKPAKDVLQRAMAKSSSGQRSRPHSLLAQAHPKGSKNRAMASLSPKFNRHRPGYAMDYTLLSSSANFTFRGDTTYYINADVNLTGTTTIEGGSVTKFTNGIAPTITISGPVVCNTSPYRPAVFTSKDDNTVGETITGSSGSPSGTYATTALKLSSGSTVALHHIRSSYAANGIQFWSGGGELKHAQLINCGVGVSCYSSATVYLRNLLINNATTALYGNGSSIKGENLTINGANSGFVNGAGTTLTLTNSILYSVTTPGTYGGANNFASFSSSPFQTVGAGSNYLATGSTLRDAGNTNIDATLAADLRKMTTEPPVVITSDFASSTVLYPVVRRDTDVPDAGYHYDPLDYCLNNLNITNATLTLTNGVSLGRYGSTMLNLRNGGKWISQGTPVSLNHVAPYQMVQEQSTAWGTLSTDRHIFQVNGGTDVGLSFTDISVGAGSANNRYLMPYTSYLTTLSISHSSLRGVYLQTVPSSSGMQVCLTNNCWEWSGFNFYYPVGYQSFNLAIWNNLFYKGSVTFYNNTSMSASIWVIKDNLFDVDGLTVISTANLTASNNGYRSGLSALGMGEKTGLVPDYQTGLLGRFYYPSTGTSTSLTNLVNTGSRNATNATLYHFTTQTSQAKETNSVVDIGFHYVAADGNGLPLDNDGDGAPDYLEDRNGNGTADSGENSWLSYTSPNSLTSSAGLQVFTPIR